MWQTLHARPSVLWRGALSRATGWLRFALAGTSSPERFIPPFSLPEALQVGIRVLMLAAGHGGGLAFAEEMTEGVLPQIGARGDYVTSVACRECHVEEHRSWHRSFHRSMTQLATTNSMRGVFNGSAIESEGLVYRVFQEGDRFWAEMPDPDLVMYAVQGDRKVPLDRIPRVKRPVVMATGSHHYQTYWVSSARHPTVLHTLPLVYLLEEQRWIPREAAFLHGPDDEERFEVQWNNQCIRCHSTGGNPGLDERTGKLNTRVAELGIACEACHGPGREHVLKQKALFSTRGPDRGVSAPDPTIVQPSRLGAKGANEICGQCHGEYITRDEFAMENARNGPLYRPGENLHRTRYYVQHPRPGSARQRWEDLRKNPQFFRERWWPDGTILAGGREYTALRASACFLKGQLSCLNCHSMHASDPDDQLKRQGGNSKSCLECHREARFTSELSRHTFHAAESSGSDCLNCHMPHTSYALLKGIRSHQISSPRLDHSVKVGVPNACNLCHLDRTLGWTESQLVARYGQSKAPLTAEQENIAASVLWLLKGDAAQRAITAWHYGWPPAQRASGTPWMTPLLASLLKDSYGVVRQIGFRSLRSVDPTLAAGYDFLAPMASREAAAAAVASGWRISSPIPSSMGSNVLIGADGNSMTNVVARLLKEQDRRSVTIQE